VTHRVLFLAAVLWIGLKVPHLGAVYSFEWDSSQFSRAAGEYDILKHQPHPPGYPLWSMAARAAAPLAGSPNRAQIWLALLFTLASFPAFALLAREVAGAERARAATLLLAFSPVVCLYSAVALTYAVDLFASCWTAWFAWRMWNRDPRPAIAACVLLAVAAGFRPSVAAMLAPLLFVALLKIWSAGRLRVMAAALAGAAAGLAWYIPTALSVGGPAALQALNRAQAHEAFAKTSVLYGAAWRSHTLMACDTALYLGVAVCGTLAALAVSRKRPGMPSDRMFFALWVAPVLAFSFLLHTPKAGYIMLAIPALVLLAATGLDRLRLAAAAGIAVSLAVSYFPYERYMQGRYAGGVFVMFRSTPKIALQVESSQRELARLATAAPPGAAWICDMPRPEGPNMRTVTYDFPHLDWRPAEGPPPPGAMWLTTGASPPPVAGARRIGGDAYFALWVTPPLAAP
jgi:4-amino-4-deoxy-L-arabinose transferase-like glycosyltransferase